MLRIVARAFGAVLLLWPTFASVDVASSSQEFVTDHEPQSGMRKSGSGFSTQSSLRRLRTLICVSRSRTARSLSTRS